jgi:hypothetical protein
MKTFKLPTKKDFELLDDGNYLKVYKCCEPFKQDIIGRNIYTEYDAEGFGPRFMDQVNFKGVEEIYECPHCLEEIEYK